MKIKEIRGFGEIMARKGLAERSLEIAREMVDDGSYKRAIKGAGQLHVIFQACSFDDYWDEKAKAGESFEQLKLANLSDKISAGTTMTMPCLYCKKDIEVKPGGLEEQGVLNVFCKDRNCEDYYAQEQ